MHPSFLILLLFSMVATDALAKGRGTRPTPAAATTPGKDEATQRKWKKCAESRTEYKAQAAKVFDEDPNTNFFDRNTRARIMGEYCKYSRNAPINRSKGSVGICETTVSHSLNLITSADQKLGEACLLAESLEKDRTDCNQTTCDVKLRKGLKAITKKYEEAQKLVKKGVEELKPMVLANREALNKIGVHLGVVAKIVKEYNDRAQRDFHSTGQQGPALPLSALTVEDQRRVIEKGLREKLGAEFASVEGSGDVAEILKNHKIDLSSPHAVRNIEAQALSIQNVASREFPDSVEQYETKFGAYASEQLASAYAGDRIRGLGISAEQELAGKITYLNSRVAELDRRISGAASLPEGAPVKNEPASNVNSGKPTGGSATPAYTRLTGGPSSTLGASRAMKLASLGASASAMNNLSQASAQGEDHSQAGPAIPLPHAYVASSAPSASTERTKENTAIKLSDAREESKKAKDEDALPATDLGMLEPVGDLSVRTVHTYPIYNDARNGDSYTPYGGAQPAAARAPASESGGQGEMHEARKNDHETVAKAAAVGMEDPAMTAYVDRQISRMEAGGRKFTPSLREKMRDQLKAGYSLRQLAASSAARKTGSNEAVAGLIQEMRENGTLPDQRERDQRFSLAGAETEEQIRKLLKDLPSEDDASFGILDSQSQSLFERVHAVHQRRFGGAKVAAQ